jgi:hypothetical protein
MTENSRAARATQCGAGLNKQNAYAEEDIGVPE